MSKVMDKQLGWIENDFLCGRTIEPNDLLRLLDYFCNLNLEQVLCKKDDMVDHFHKWFTLVEESDEIPTQMYWRVYKYLPNNTYYKQSCYYSSYENSPMFHVSMWSQVKPIEVSTTHYYEV